MQTKNQGSNKIDDYLHRIEAREKASRRRNILIGVAILALLGGGGIGYKFLKPPTQLPVYALEMLDHEMVEQLFEEHSSPIVVIAPNIGTDTLMTVEEYDEIVDLVAFIDSNKEQSAYNAVSEGEFETPEAPVEDVQSLEKFIVDVAGNREVGETLTFTIENFRTDHRYILDFGNGVRRRVGRTTQYAYTAPGQFRLILRASNSEGASSVYSKRYKITGEPQTQPQIASNEVPSTANNGSQTNRESSSTTRNLVIEDLTRAQGDSAKPGVDESTFIASADPSAPIPIEPRSNPNNGSLSRTTQNRESNVIPPAELKNYPSSSPVTQPALDQPLVAAEVMPEFPGGLRSMGRFFKKQYKYPASARDAGVQGVVHVRFVVNTDGSIRDPKVVRGIGAGCDKEALRLVSIMPKWIPGEQNGDKVPVYRTIPISFRLLE